MKKVKKTKYYAYVASDSSRNLSFTVHYSKFAAERHYGDLGRHYKGSSHSDYTLVVYTKEEMEKDLVKDYIIDYKKKTLTLRDKPLSNIEIEAGKGLQDPTGQGWYHSSDLDGSDINYYETQPRTSESYNYTGPFKNFHECKMDAIAYHTTNKNTALNAIKDIKTMRKRDLKK